LTCNGFLFLGIGCNSIYESPSLKSQLFNYLWITNFLYAKPTVVYRSDLLLECL